MYKIIITTLFSILLFSGCVQTVSEVQKVEKKPAKACCCDISKLAQCPNSVSTVHLQVGCKNCNNYPVTVRTNSNCSSCMNSLCTQSNCEQNSCIAGRCSK